MTMVFTQSMTSVTKVTLVVESASRWNTSTHTIFIHWTESWPEFQGLHYVVFVLQWLFFFQNVIFMAVTNRDNRPYLTYSKKNLRPTLPNQLLRGIILAPGKNLCISGTPMMRLNQALLATCSRFLWRGDIQVESEWNSEDFWCWGLEVIMVGFV